MMIVGIATDHGGYALKDRVIQALSKAGYEVKDFGAYEIDSEDDYPDYVVPMVEAVVEGKVARGIAICGSGVGACIVANKVKGGRAALISDVFSAHQGVEDDDMNVICLGGRVMGFELAWDLIQAFLTARFTGAKRFRRRLDKVTALERQAQK